MGGSSKKATVGYKYYLGVHMVLCHGPVDRLQRIDVDDRTAWAGFNQGGRININNADMFGGESREGGVSGPVDIMMGETGQGKNDYLVSKLGAQVPSFRGVVSAVLRQCYLGMNPYLKPWSFRVQRILKRGGGQAQWYPTKASIGTVNSAAMYFALDVSGSMNTDGRLANMKAAVTSVLESFLGLGPSSQMDIRVVAFGDTATSITRYNAGTSDIQAIIDWVNSLTVTGGTNYATGMGRAPNFFANTGDKPRFVFFLTDGEPSPTSSAADAVAIRDGLPPTEVYCFNIDLADTTYTGMLDNTPRDGVPIVPGGDPAPLANAVMSALFVQLDMNPAHIIRECLTDTEWGMGYLEADLDDVSFRAAADRLHQEQMGMSLLWTKQTEIEEFIKEVLKHINAVVRVNRRTGKFELKLIREDYDEETLLELNPSNIERLTDFSRPSFGELVNSVTVNYWDPVTGGDASLTVQDIALAEAQRAVVNTTLQYPGFTNSILASRVAERDLRTLSNPLVSCVIYTDTIAKDLGVGDVFKLVWPDYLIAGMVMRVTQIAYGNGRSNKIKITCTQDVFALPETVAFEPEPPVWEDPDVPPVPIQYRAVFELPYLELVRLNSQEVVDSQLALNPDMGYLGAAAVRPQDNAISARLMVDEGAGYEDVANVDFCPGAVLDVAIGRMDTVLTIRDGKDLDGVVAGSWCQIGDELLAVEDLTDNVLTVKRGCLDTVPADHPAGAPILFWDGFGQSAPTEYVRSETLAVRLLTVTGSGELPLDQAGDNTVTMNARAFRPYPPAQLRVNGMFFPTQPLTAITLTWVHRNRVQQTGQSLLGFMDPGVTPEDGTTYFLEIWTGDQTTRLKRIEGITGNTYNVPTEDIPPGEDSIWLKFGSRRDGYDCWQPHYFQVNLSRNYGDNILFEMDEINTPVPGDAIQFDM